MASLAVFDFDRTLVLDDSDAAVIGRLRETQPPPEWEAGNHDWTPYMNEVFEHAFSAGLSQADILACVAALRPTPGVAELLAALAARGWHVLLLTDSNSVFVNHWLKVHQLQEYVTAVVTNRGSWRGARLCVAPCMRQASCARCPRNLCKARALRQWCEPRAPYRRVVYVGDGRNDFCPAASLPASATVFPRKGYPLAELIAESRASPASPACPAPRVCAKVVPWEDAYTILHELIPDAVIPT